MQADPFIAEIHDYPETDMVFPGQNIRGGYVIFKIKITPLNKVVNYEVQKTQTLHRQLLEEDSEIFVRYNQAVSTLIR